MTSGHCRFSDTSITLTTAYRPGAVAAILLHGQHVEAVLQELTGKDGWVLNRARLSDFAGIDKGLAVLVRPASQGGPGLAQLMPHGGPRVVQKLLDYLVELGLDQVAEPDTRLLYPEADSAIEADALACLARSASPAAIDLLLAQPRLWRNAVRRDAVDGEAIKKRTDVLNRLIDPPSVVVAGRPNVGKSTLMNRLSGRSASVVADLPGTTRDWVGGLVELAGGIAVRWLDTPGLRDSDDAIEQRAIGIAQDVIASADVLIVMRDAELNWPDVSTLPREPDLYVVNKIDRARLDSTNADTVCISAETGQGMDQLQERVVSALGFSKQTDAELWAFSPTLNSYLSGQREVLNGYL